MGASRAPSSGSSRTRAVVAALRAEMTYYREHSHEARDRAAPRRAARRLRRAALARARTRGERRDADGVDPLPCLRRRGAGARRAARARARLVCVSNWDIALPRGARARAAWPGALDGVVASAAVGARKPDPAIFAAALELAGCAPRRGAARRRHAGRGRRRRPRAGIPHLLLVRDGAPGRGRDCVADRDRPASPDLTDELDQPAAARRTRPSQPPPPTGRRSHPRARAGAAARGARRGSSAGSRSSWSCSIVEAGIVSSFDRDISSLGARLALQALLALTLSPTALLFASPNMRGSPPSRSSASAARCARRTPRWRSPTSAISPCAILIAALLQPEQEDVTRDLGFGEGPLARLPRRC